MLFEILQSPSIIAQLVENGVSDRNWRNVTIGNGQISIGTENYLNMPMVLWVRQWSLQVW